MADLFGPEPSLPLRRQAGHGHDEAPKIRKIDEIVQPGEEVIDGVRLSFAHATSAETTDQLTISLPDEKILIAQDILSNHVHLFLAERRFDTWQRAIKDLSAQPWEAVLPGHGSRHDPRLFDICRAYLETASLELAAATSPEDLNNRLMAAYPDYAGTSIQPLWHRCWLPRRWWRSSPDCGFRGCHQDPPSPR